LVIKGASPTKTDEQLMTFYGNYSALSAIELFHLAVITADLAKKEEVLKAFTAANAEDWRGFNDLGAIQLKLNNLIDAESNLSKANALSADNAAVLANMGVLANAKGNVAEAEKMFKSASSKGTDVSYNLACIAIKKGNYSEAVSLFNKSGKADFNATLAKLLSGDATGAKNMIDAMNPDQLDASHYYLRAVCGARMNNQDVLTTNLARAVGMNGEIRKMAKDDVEFIKFFSNPLFEGAIR
jgi:tetratricopeptide (TPR) repeat protein